MSDSQKYIGDKLRLAREEQMKSISDMSEKTNIRKSFIAALEKEDFETLPEPIYTKNFIKLYARALGLEPDDLIDYYQSHYQKEEIENVNNIPEYKDFSLEAKSNSKGLMFWLPLLLLLLLLAAAAGLWFFNRDFVYKSLPWLNANKSNQTIQAELNPDNKPETNEIQDDQVLSVENDVNNPVVTETDSGAVTEDLENDLAAQEQSPNNSEIAETIKLSIVTDPPGATVSIDNFVMAEKTPILDAPISSGEKRLLLISLDGYTSYEQELDLTKDAELVIGLEPIQIIETSDENGNLNSPLNSSDKNNITIKTSEETWLEVWQGDKRNKGEKLVYKVIPAGQEFNFELPVYIHTGNAGGVQIFLAGKDLGKMGSKGEVLGKAFTAEAAE